MNSIVFAPCPNDFTWFVLDPHTHYLSLSLWFLLLLVSFTMIQYVGHHLAVATNLEFPVRCASVHQVDLVFLVFHSVTPVRIPVTSTFGHLEVKAV